MGIDIYMRNEGVEAKREQLQGKFSKAVAHRDALPKDSPLYARAQSKVTATYDEMNCGKVGYIRSSYNSSGLFNVLDRIFGSDSAQLLFPGDWAKPLNINWDNFVAIVKQMQQMGRCLKHGDPLPVAFAELQAAPHGQRHGGEEFGKHVLGMISTMFGADNVTGGNDDAHGFFNEDDYGWYVRDGLDELLAFGELGQELQRKGQTATVEISY